MWLWVTFTPLNNFSFDELFDKSIIDHIVCVHMCDHAIFQIDKNNMFFECEYVKESIDWEIVWLNLNAAY